MLGGISMNAYATDCTKDNVFDWFGDWFGNLGKTAKKKDQNIAIRKSDRLLECTENQKIREAKAA